VAAELGHVGVLDVLLREGRADPLAHDSRALKRVSPAFSEAAVHRFLDDPRFPAKWLHAYCLCLAGERGWLGVARRVLADPRTAAARLSPTYASMTLERASEYGHRAIVDFLLDEARAELPENGLSAALNCAAMSAHCHDVGLLARLLDDPRTDPSYSNSQALVNAAFAGKEALVARLLQDPRVQPTADRGGALVAAISMGNEDIFLRLLRDPRADPMAGNGAPLVCAARKGNLRALDTLLADPRVDPNARGGAAFLMAVREGQGCDERLISDPRVDVATGDWALLDHLRKGYNHAAPFFRALAQRPNLPLEAMRASARGRTVLTFMIGTLSAALG
jgi:hypothetical protein